MSEKINEKEQAIRPGKLLDVNCPSREILQHISSRWGILILIALDKDTMRFSELKKKSMA